MIKTLLIGKIICASRLMQFFKKNQVFSNMFVSLFCFFVGFAMFASIPNQLSKKVEQQFHLHRSPFSNNLKLLEQS